jgi:hypothetical protein
MTPLPQTESVRQESAKRRGAMHVLHWPPRQPMRSNAHATEARKILAAPTSRQQELEPNADQLESEQRIIRDQLHPTIGPERQVPAPGKDLLASYMEQLSHLPLFTPEQESENARELEGYELCTWNLILAIPKAVQHLYTESTLMEPSLRTSIDWLLQSYRRAAAKSRSRKLSPSAVRDKMASRLAQELRRADFDQDLLDRYGGVARLPDNLHSASRTMMSPRSNGQGWLPFASAIILCAQICDWS